MKLYTQNVCGKCMLVKMWIKDAGKEGIVQIVNLDDEPESLRDKLRKEGLQSLPILEVEGKRISDINEIQRIIEA